MLTFEFHGNQGTMKETEELHVGDFKAQVRFLFSPEWEKLKKTVAFMTIGSTVSTTVHADLTDEILTIPYDVLLHTGSTLYVQVTGYLTKGTTELQTDRVEGPEILPGQDPGEMPEMDANNPVWRDVLTQMGELGELQTGSKTTLVAAINELAALGPGKGASAYEIAKEHGYQGTEAQWLASLAGQNGKSAYAYAQDAGYTGTEEDFTRLLISKNILTVTLTGYSGNYSSDVSYYDIAHAHSNGNPVLLRYGAHITHILAGSPSETSFLFEPLLHSIPGIHGYTVNVQSVWEDAPSNALIRDSDIVNNLTTNAENKPLSAAQGMTLKKQIDDLAREGNEILIYGYADDAKIALAMQSGRPVYCLYELLYYLPLVSWEEATHTAVFGISTGNTVMTCTAEAGTWSFSSKNTDFSIALEEALAQAKESGIFDGRDGLDATPVTPLFANSIAECTDTTKPYVLPDGYIYAYMGEVTEGSSKPNFTNQLPLAKDTDGSVYNGQGYKTDSYLSGGNPGSRSGVECTGFIPIGFGSSQSASGEQVIYLSGVDAKADDGNCRMAFYNANKDYILQFGANQFATGGSYNIPMGITTDASGNFLSIDITAISAYFHEHESQDIAYFRICATEINADSVITVNEKITYTTTEGGMVYQWKNTGHAFVSADYEDRILALEEDVADLKITGSTGSAPAHTDAVPETVVAAATALVDKALSRSGNRILRFLISADAHQKNDHELITKGTTELGQAHGEVLKQIGVDFVANLGDISWGASSSNNATVAEECRTFNRLMLKHIRGQKQIWTEGNHETGMLTDSQIHGFIYSHNRDLIQDTDHWIDGYGYMDFPNQKVRVICLNTDQSTGNDSSGVSDAQLKWFAEIALNMEDKTDWSVITMGHHPLSYNNVTLFRNCVSVVEAFVSKANFTFTTNGGTQIAIDYSNKSCQYVAHFHGHAHSYSMVKMQKYVSADNYLVLTPFEICIPNACYERNNQYLNNGAYTERYANAYTYNKSDEDGKRTAFNLVTVCLDEKKIYADNYGVGIDRVISY